MGEARKPLYNRLWAARVLVQDWRRALYDSAVCRSGPNKGTLDDPKEARELERFNSAIAALTEAIAANRPARKAPKW